MELKIYPSIENAILLCLLFLGLQIGFGVLTVFIVTLFKGADQFLEVGIATGLTNLIAFSIVLFLGFKKTKRSFNDVFKFNKVSPSLWFTVTLFMAGLVIITSELDNLVNYLLPMPEAFIQVFDMLTKKQIFAVEIIIVVVIPGFMEELLFRGLILDGLNRNYSIKKAMIISAFLFGLIHLNPWQFYSGFIIGLISAWICIRANTILLSIYMHLFNNLSYAVTVKYSGFIPIKGFNITKQGEFQPLWFDITGAVMLITGTLLLVKGLNKAKNLKALPYIA
ncbi:MAG: CPBP family intramembrane metalloprotease [Treponema sp.]|jgi:membrane protease YdiL (CAAX protease family)|nr:CPBP family intramembrane metalloprotease [Treponema sp.]